jgi:hypothetical protein
MNVADEENFSSSRFIEAFGLGARIVETTFSITTVVNMLTDGGAALEESQVREIATVAYSLEESSFSVTIENSTNRRLDEMQNSRSRRLDLAKGDVTIVMLTGNNASKAKSLRLLAAAVNLAAIARNVTGQDIELAVIEEPLTKVSLTMAVDVDGGDADELAAAKALLRDQLANDDLLSKVAAEAGAYDLTVVEEPTIVSAPTPSSTTTSGLGAASPLSTSTSSAASDEEDGKKKRKGGLVFVVICVPILSVVICCCCCGLVACYCKGNSSGSTGAQSNVEQRGQGLGQPPPPPNLLTQEGREIAVKNSVPHQELGRTSSMV